MQYGVTVRAVVFFSAIIKLKSQKSGATNLIRKSYTLMHSVDLTRGIFGIQKI